MAIIKAKARQTTSVGRVSEGQDVYIKALRDGSMTVADWIAAMSLEGRVFTCNSGSGTTAKAWGSGTLDTKEQDLSIVVPSGTVIIPLEVRIHFVTYGDAQLVECLMASGTGDTVGTGVAVTTTESSNLNSGLATACTITEGSATGVAIATNIKEIWRDGIQMGITIATVGQVRIPEIFTWRAKDSGILDVVGPSESLVIYASAHTGTGCICVKYVELPVSAVT